MSVAIGPYQAFYTGVPAGDGAISLRPFVAKDPSRNTSQNFCH